MSPVSDSVVEDDSPIEMIPDEEEDSSCSTSKILCFAVLGMSWLGVIVACVKVFVHEPLMLVASLVGLIFILPLFSFVVWFLKARGNSAKYSELTQNEYDTDDIELAKRKVKSTVLNPPDR